jgi:site-specific DNA-cytosine methylase
MKNKIGIFSFFSGAGFLDLGFEKTKGFETVFVNEFHAPFVEIYKGSREKLGIPKPNFGYHVRSIEEFLKKNELADLSDKLKIAQEEFEIPKNITLSNSFKAIGNGVPYLAGRGLALTILNFISTFDSAYKSLLNGEIDGSKPSQLYRPNDRKKVIQEANMPQLRFKSKEIPAS